MPPDIRGEARPILHMNDSATDIIFGSQIVRWKASGLQFLGGRNQLHVGNNNTDKGQIIINDCSFDYASGAAIRLLEPSRSLQPPNVGKPADRRGPPTHRLENFHGSFSTHVAISESVFSSAQVLINWADWTRWIPPDTTAPSMPNDTAVIENHDRTWLSNVLGVRVRYGVPLAQRGSTTISSVPKGACLDARVSLWWRGRRPRRRFQLRTCLRSCAVALLQIDHLRTHSPQRDEAANTTTVVAGSAITITDSTIDTHQEIIELVEVPAAIFVRQ